MSILRRSKPSKPLKPLRRITLFVVAALIVIDGKTGWGHGAIDERVAELTEEVAKSPQDASLYFQLADANCQHEDWIAAMRALARAEELAPGTFPVDLMRGRINLGAKRPEIALEALDRSLKARPGNPLALIYRARALELIGRGQEGLADYRAALAVAVNPEPDHFQEVAEAMAKYGRPEEAVSVLVAGITRLGPVPSLIMKAMAMEMATGKFDDALQRVEMMRISAPRPEPWMGKRAEILEQAGRYGEALAAWQALVTHISALPNLERGSHAMNTLAEQAQNALRRISSATPTSYTARP